MMHGSNTSIVRAGGMVLLIALIVMVSPLDADAKPTTGEWSTLFTLAEAGGVTGVVKEIVTFDGDLIIGGEITAVAAGNLTVNNLAGFDGQNWYRFGGVTDGDPGSGAYALAVFGGDLIVGGRFQTAGGVSAANIARYDGENWYPMGDGLGGASEDVVMDLCIYDGSLYAGGRFAFSGAAAINQVARWDGAQWQPCGWPYDGVMALTVYNDRLVAAGDPIYVMDDYRAYVAGWDGSTWLGLGYLPGFVTSLCTLEGLEGETLFAGGLLNGMLSPVYLDGGWSTFQGGVDSKNFSFPPVVSSLGVIKGNLVVGGWFDFAGTVEAWGVAMWNGKWRSLDFGVHDWDAGLGGDIPGHVYALLTDDQSGEIYVGGKFGTVSDGSIKSPGLALFQTKTKPVPPSGAGADIAGLSPERKLAAAPNPFETGTSITFRLDEAGPVRLRIFDVLGRSVVELVNGEEEAGVHTVTWSGRDGTGLPVTAGIYFAVVDAPSGRATQKLMVVK